MAQPFGRDNINPHSDYYVHREQKAKEILHQVRLRGAVLVRAGFFSGKSSFIHSIKREAKPIYEDRVYSLDAVKLARKFKDVWPKDFAEVIKEGTRMSGTEMSTEDFDHACDFASSKKPTLFIIDEVQVCIRLCLLSLFYHDRF